MEIIPGKIYRHKLTGARLLALDSNNFTKQRYRNENLEEVWYGDEEIEEVKKDNK